MLILRHCQFHLHSVLLLLHLPLVFCLCSHLASELASGFSFSQHPPFFVICFISIILITICFFVAFLIHLANFIHLNILSRISLIPAIAARPARRLSRRLAPRRRRRVSLRFGRVPRDAAKAAGGETVPRRARAAAPHDLPQTVLDVIRHRCSETSAPKHSSQYLAVTPLMHFRKRIPNGP
jgi:hypothetical protein